MEITVKKPNEKLVKLEISIKDFQIEDVCISGDFFIYPEEGIKDIENAIKGDIRDVDKRIEDLFKNKDIKLVGISKQTIIECINNLIEKYKGSF